MFTGFTGETLDFLWGIRFNNQRDWFASHKDDYLTQLYRPMQVLGGEIYDFLRGCRPDYNLIHKVSRIYRDARRLHGRGPYKDRLWFSVEEPAEQWTAKPTFWFELAPDVWSYGLGYYMARPATMARLRARMDRDSRPMEALSRALAEQTEFILETDEYKRPKAAAPVPLLEPWYRAKSFSLIHSEKPAEELFSSALAEHLKQGYTFLLPYYDYFVTLDGDPDPAEHHRGTDLIDKERQS